MRYEFTDFEWTAIRPFLPNSRAVCRGLTTGVSSTGFFGYCVQVHRGATYRTLWVLRALL